MNIDRSTFEQQRKPRFGRANPEWMRLAFWEAMVREDEVPYTLRQQFETGDEDGPIWNFSRMGMTRTELPDGRTICVAGEHEDYYDPDFYIYNDVIVLRPGGEVEIYGYPKEVFPPTDFHTATLVEDRIVVIGTIGYPAERRSGVSLVHSLDLATYRIDPVATHGNPPGWIHEHQAELDPGGASITIRGGQVIEKRDGKETFRLNLEEYRLHLTDGRWEQVTDRRAWRQFEIQRVESGLLFDRSEVFDLRDRKQTWFDEDVFRPKDIPHEPLPVEELRRYGLIVDGVKIRAEDEGDLVRLIVEGVLPTALVDGLVEEFHRNIEAAVEAPCRVEEL